MTKEQAIKLLGEVTSREEINRLKQEGLDKETILDIIQEALDMGIEALEKQIAKKPINAELLEMHYIDDDVKIMYGDCAVCGFNVHSDICDYCPNCGQKIDWSEVDGKI